MVTRKTCRLMRLCGAAIVVLWSMPAAGAFIKVSYGDSAGEGFYDPVLGQARRASMQRAADLWESYLTNKTTIHVRADFAPLGGGKSGAILGRGGPQKMVVNFRRTPQKKVYFPAALAEALAGKNYTGKKADILVTFNSDIDGAVLGKRDWHYGAGLPSGGDIDFQTVAMHELGHGLGIISSFKSDGSWGHKKRPYVYDTMLVNAAMEELLELTPAAVNVTSPVYFDGPAANFAYRAAGGSGPAPIYAPATFRAGSSISHLDEATFHGIDDLMTPYISTPQRDISPIVRGMLHDMGWSVVPEPAALAVLLTGAALLILRRRNK